MKILNSYMVFDERNQWVLMHEFECGRYCIQNTDFMGNIIGWRWILQEQAAKYIDVTSEAITNS